MKSFLSLCLMLLVGSLATAQVTPEWVRYPAISPDGSTIAFTYKGDLYTVPTNGGEATRITFHLAHDYMPVWSKDGKHLAFASDRYGNFDIYVMEAAGGEATRLTFHSNDEEPYTFSADGKSILFKAQRQDLATHRQYPTGRQAELYSVPVGGGRVDQIFTVPAENVQVTKDGSQLVYHDNKGFEDPWRKHHRSAITRDIWTYDVKSGKHTKISTFYGEDRNPVYDQSEENIYYLSEEGGTFNVHKQNIANPSSKSQLTRFNTHPVRFLSIGNGTLSFGYHGHVYTMREGSEPKRVEITIRTQDATNTDEIVDVNGGVSEMAVSPDGKEIAFISRGEVFVTTVDGSLTKRVTKTPEAERFVSFTPDGESLVYASERDGKWSIYQTKKVREEEPFFYASSLLNEEVLISNKLDNYLPKVSPDGKKLAFVEDRRTLKVMDMESKRSITLLTPEDLYHMRDGDKDFSWSPDSKWLLMQYDKLLNNSDIVLLDASGKEEMKTLIPSGYYDVSPKWVNEGKQMIWFSNRNGLKSYATSGSSEFDVYSMFFTQEAWDKYNLSEEDFKLMEELEKAKKAKEEKKDDDDDKEKDEDKKEEDASLTFDWDGMEDRIARFTIHSSRLGDAVLSKDGSKLYYLSSFEGGQDLWVTNLRTRDTKKAISLNTGGASLVWDDKMENLYLLSRGRIAKIDPDAGSQKPISISSEMEYDAAAEREVMFEHVALRTSKIFYEPTFHGIDWDMMVKEYQPKIAHTGNGYEFAELLSEILGELNVSHAGGRFGDNIDNGDATASMGIFMDYEHNGDGIKIVEVMKGGPLDKAEFDVKPGMIIQKIDGEVVSADQDVAKYLNRKAGKFTLLEITDERGRNPMVITIKPISLGAESSLLYDRFVERNAKEVEEKSGGKLGYVHIPGMGDGPYRSIYEDMMGKYYDTEAVIVDTRFNGGGDLVADLAMFFTGERFITYATADKVVGGEPTSRWTKPTLTMFNESNYSDGHCYAQGYTDLDIGTTLGMPVPGTCSFAGWERLPNGGVWGVVPVSAKDKSGRWMENLETKPDIEVKNMPGVIDFGRDQQLERAIEELMKEVK